MYPVEPKDEDDFTFRHSLAMSGIFAVMIIAYWWWRTPVIDLRVPLALIGLAIATAVLFLLVIENFTHTMIGMVWAVVLLWGGIINPLEHGDPVMLEAVLFISGCMLLGGPSSWASSGLFRSAPTCPTHSVQTSVKTS